MGVVYSERILLWGAIGAGPDFVVPAGKRVVVKSVSTNNSSAFSAGVAVALNGQNVWAVVLQAQAAAASPIFMLVAYPGETLHLYHSQASVFSQASGYMLDAPAGVELQPAQIGLGPAVEPA